MPSATADSLVRGDTSALKYRYVSFHIRKYLARLSYPLTVLNSAKHIKSIKRGAQVISIPPPQKTKNKTAVYIMLFLASVLNQQPPIPSSTK